MDSRDFKLKQPGFVFCAFLLTILCGLCLTVELIVSLKRWHIAWKTGNTMFGNQKQMFSYICCVRR